MKRAFLYILAILIIFTIAIFPVFEKLAQLYGLNVATMLLMVGLLSPLVMRVIIERFRSSKSPKG